MRRRHFAWRQNAPPTPSRSAAPVGALCAAALRQHGCAQIPAPGTRRAGIERAGFERAGIERAGFERAGFAPLIRRVRQ